MLLHRSIVAFAVAAYVVGTAVAASAQSPDATASPSASSTPMPREIYAIIDAGVSTQVFNQLSPGSHGSSLAVQAGIEYPVLGHNWDASFAYTEWNYPHPSKNNGTSNNTIVGSCPIGDPGCVTPIGFNSYATVTPGIAQYMTSFQAQDSAEQFGLGPRISKNTRLYLESSWAWRSFNYSTVPAMSGWGVGLDMLPNTDKQIALYGGFWTYFDVHGSYAGPVSPLLGAYSGVPFLVDYRMYTYRFGLTYTLEHSPLFVDANVAGDRLDARSASVPSDVVHTAVSLGLGAHI